MNSTLIIGIGNEFRCDDAVGILIARKLKNDFLNFNVIEKAVIDLNLLELFKKWDTVILLDALKNDNKEPGTLEIFVLADNFVFNDLPYFSSHSISLDKILQFGKLLNSLPKKLIIIGINSSNFQIGTELSFDIEKTYQLVKEVIKTTSHIFE